MARIDLVVIDGPNVYNTVAQLLIGSDEWAARARGYFLEWFDLDRLVRHTLSMSREPRLGIVIFHSRKALGKNDYRLEQDQTDSFWIRQGANPHTSIHSIDIPGKQQTTMKGTCSRCNQEVVTYETSEKGIDTSICTYLLETVDSWQTVCIFSKDVDYVPLVWTLRRKGKRVLVCAGDRNESMSALVLASQSAHWIDREFLQREFYLYSLFCSNGIMTEIYDSVTNMKQLETIRVSVGLRQCVTQDSCIKYGSNEVVGIDIWHGGHKDLAEEFSGLIKGCTSRFPHLANAFEWECRANLLCLNLRCEPQHGAGISRWLEKNFLLLKWRSWIATPINI